ncbi:hypothetical protein CANCADRAFT_19190, partial [Tortispora caseinolytica NRRL Y-17796]
VTMRMLLGRYNTKVDGMNTLLEAIERSVAENRGLLTVSNHVSVYDDPIIWGTLPPDVHIQSIRSRWTLAAADLCFTNRLVSAFFRIGQTMEVHRFGRGPFQPSLDASVLLLSPHTNYTPSVASHTPSGTWQPRWIHIYPEGKVSQLPGLSMRYFKWGASRLVLEPTVSPIVVPIFHSGLEKVLPETRSPPRFWPRYTSDILHFTFGEPLPDDSFDKERMQWYQMV